MTDNTDTYRFKINEEQIGQRIDKVLVELCDGLSRSFIQDLIEKKHVLLNGMPLSSSSYKCALGDIAEINIPEAEPMHLEPEDIPLDIVFEDQDVLVINKPAGMVVHPGAGNYSGTLVNAVLYHCGDDLSGIGGVMRPGIVHRLDKDTNGLMVVAKNDYAHQHLSKQLSERTLSRIYHCICLGEPKPIKGVIDKPIGRHPKHRQKMAINMSGRQAKTHYKVLQSYEGLFSHVECVLESGRTHQIRVHMMDLGHPLIGDPLYGPQNTAVKSALKKRSAENAQNSENEPLSEEEYNKNRDFILSFPRQALQAIQLSFMHPRTEQESSFQIPLESKLSKLLKCI